MRQDCVKIVCDRCGEELVVEAKMEQLQNPRQKIGI